MTLIQASGNRRVLGILANQHVLSRVWGFLPERPTVRTLAKSYREHWQILRYVRRGDAEGACAAMRRHIALGREKVLDRYDWEQRQAAAGVEPEWFWPPALHEAVHRMEQEHAGGVPAAACAVAMTGLSQRLTVARLVREPSVHGAWPGRCRERRVPCG